MNWWKCWRWFCTKKNISKGWASAVEAVMPVMRNFWGGNANLFWGEMQLFWSELLRHWWHSAFNLQSLAFHDPLQPRIFQGIFLDFSFNSCPLVSWLDKSTALTNLLTFIFCDFLLFLWLDENQPLSDNPHRKSALWPIFSRIFWKENCSSDPNILQQFLLQGSISWVYKNTEKESSFPDFVNFGNSFLFLLWPSLTGPDQKAFWWKICWWWVCRGRRKRMYCRIFSKVQQWGNKSLPGLPADNSYLSFIEFLFVHFLLKFLFGACIVSEIDLFQSKCATQRATNHWWNCCWHLRARKDNQGLQNGQQDQNTFSAVYFSWGNDVRGGVCHNLSWFLCSFLFWCSTHNFDFLWLMM